MSLVDRAKNILLKPAEEWNVIADEQATVGSLVTNYAAVLSLIPAVIGFIAALALGAILPQLMGRFAPDFTIDVLLLQSVIAYAVGLLMVFIMSQVVNAISPSFNGRQDLVQATKLIVYSSTAVWVASLLLVIPLLGFLLYLGGIAYSVYLIYLGLQPVLGVPKDKVAGMTVVIVISYLVISIVVGIVQNILVGMGPSADALTGA